MQTRKERALAVEDKNRVLFYARINQFVTDKYWRPTKSKRLAVALNSMRGGDPKKPHYMRQRVLWPEDQCPADKNQGRFGGHIALRPRKTSWLAWS